MRFAFGIILAIALVKVSAVAPAHGETAVTGLREDVDRPLESHGHDLPVAEALGTEKRAVGKTASSKKTKVVATKTTAKTAKVKASKVKPVAAGNKAATAKAKAAVKAAQVKAAAATPVPIFLMDCSPITGYPEVCDNFCVLTTCHGFNTATGFLHRDTNADTKAGVGTAQTFADLRRKAIGCGSTNYCASTGLDCDEQPPASTYDGGVGCIAGKFKTPSQLLQVGVTRCVNLSQNRRHGNRLKTFYSTAKLADQAPFRISFVSQNNSTICKALATQGKAACPNESATQALPGGKKASDLGTAFTPFSQRSKTAKAICPSGPLARRAGFADFRSLEERDDVPRNSSIYVTDTEGKVLHLPHGAAPDIGESIIQFDANGNPKTTYVASIL